MPHNRKKLTLEQLEKIMKYPDTQYSKNEQKRKDERKKGHISYQTRVCKLCWFKVRAYARKKAQKLELGTYCEFCESTEELERHHPDYEFPKIFITCCITCHNWIHNNVKLVQRTTKCIHHTK